jgi:hypothetical protein
MWRNIQVWLIWCDWGSVGIETEHVERVIDILDGTELGKGIYTPKVHHYFIAFT